MQGDIKTLQEGQKTMQGDIKTIQGDISGLKEGQNTLELKTEAFHAEQRRANKDISLLVHDMVEITLRIPMNT
jgi:peptidoglycan hydrolase CwlO-like protein